MSSIDGKTKLLAIFGNPVEHSKSPRMHNANFAYLGINAAYVPLRPGIDKIGDAVKGFRAMGFLGANVTIPFKERVGEFLDELSPVAKFTGSVNTLYWKDGVIGGTLCGTTTDPYGALLNLKEAGVDVQGKLVALLGNGGAARAIAFSLLERGARLAIVCRDRSKGEALSEALRGAFPGTSAPKVFLFAEFQRIAGVDIILNATSVGMTPDEDASPLPKDVLLPRHFVYDIIYAPAETKLMREAKAAGCKTLGGSAMLVYQGAKSFEFWFPGKTADVSVMKKALGMEA
jgi:shikimate dehydrogenase